MMSGCVSNAAAAPSLQGRAVQQKRASARAALRIQCSGQGSSRVVVPSHHSSARVTSARNVAVAAKGKNAAALLTSTDDGKVGVNG